MSAKANPVRIGVFVVGAIALVVAGLLAFGSRDLFTKHPRYIAFFEGSVAGLRIGAPVNFRGVPIGEVVDIRLLYHTKDGEILLPVVFETIPGAISVVDAEHFEAENEVQKLIERGLRAQLSPVSMVTGQLSIELALHPGTEPNLVGGEQPHVEMPTVPSDIQFLETQLQALLGSESADEGVKGVLDGFSQILGDDNRRQVSTILQGMAKISTTFSDHDGDIARALEKGSRLVDDAGGVIADLRKLVSTTEKAVTRLGDAIAEREDDIATSIKDFNAAVQSITRMADQINNAVAETRPGLRDFSTNTLYATDGLVLDLEQLTQKLGRIADQLERDPPGFLFGGQAGQGIKTP